MSGAPMPTLPGLPKGTKPLPTGGGSRVSKKYKIIITVISFAVSMLVFFVIYPAVTPHVAILGAPPKAITFDKKVYSWTGRVYISIIDNTANSDQNVANNINVTISTKNYTIPNYKLVETGPNTGIFYGYVTLTGDPKIDLSSFGKSFLPLGSGPSGSGPANGLIPAQVPDSIAVTYRNVENQQTTASAPIHWNVGQISWLQPSYKTNGQGVLQVVDPDMNLSPDRVDKFTLTASSGSDPKGVKVTMTETSRDTGTFVGMVIFTNSSSSSNALQVSEGDDVSAQYLDKTLPSYSANKTLALGSRTFIGTPLYSIESSPLDIQEMTVTYNNTPPTFDTEQFIKILHNIEISDVPEKITPVTNHNITSAVPGTETIVIDLTHNAGFSANSKPRITLVSSEGDGTVSYGKLNVLLNQTMPLNITGNASPVEPSVASNGSLIFYTTNYGDARSEDGGKHWTFLDASRNPIFFLKNFCCDQDVIYDPYHHFFIWEQLGTPDQNPSAEKFRLAVSSDLEYWKFHDFALTDFGITQGGVYFWDQPKLAVTPTHLFVTANLEFFNGTGSHNVIIRMDPTQIDANIPKPKFEMVINTDGYSIVPVQGATDPMYFASQTDHNDRLKIFRWYDNNPVMAEPISRNIDAWTSNISADMICTTPPYDNWCGDRADTRILNGWQIGDSIGFFWNAPQDNEHGFVYPYLDAAVFDTSNNLRYLGRPDMWSSSTPFLYGNSYPTSNGLGWMVFSGTHGPILNVGVANPSSLLLSGKMGSPWVAETVVNPQTQGTEFGDYARVRSFDNDGCNFMASGYTYMNSTDTGRPTSQPFLIVFNKGNCAN